MQDLDDLIEIFPEEANDEYFRSAENRPKRQNYGTRIDQLIMSFDGNTYNSGNKIFMGEQE